MTPDDDLIYAIEALVLTVVGAVVAAGLAGALVVRHLTGRRHMT